MQNAAREKTMTRHTSEKSLRSDFSFAIAVVSTHFILGKSLWNKNINLLPKGAQENIKLLSKLNSNAPHIPINPNLTLSTDDTTMHVHEGIAQKNLNGW